MTSQRQTEHQAAASPVKVRRLVFSDAGKIAVEHEKGTAVTDDPNGARRKRMPPNST